jgi:hypothetical protein
MIVQKCGTPLYDDFAELQDGAAKRLELSFRSGSKSSSATTSRGTNLLKLTQSILFASALYFRQIFGKKDQQGLPTQLQNIPGTTQPTTSLPQHTEAMYLLICHDESLRNTKLLQLPVADLQSDEKLFTALRTEYQTRRRKWWSFLSFRTLTGIQSVRFEIYRRSQSVDVPRTNDLPSPTNTEYRYTPVPVDLMPPIGENLLMHFFQHPDHAEDGPACLDRFPKKLRHILACGTQMTALGWGLQLEEGLNWKKAVTVFCGCVLVSTTWGVCWSVLRDDIQGAFAISAYMAGIVAPIATLMQVLE